MSLYLIFSIITVFLALAFVLLHLAAAVSAILKGKKKLRNWIYYNRCHCWYLSTSPCYGKSYLGILYMAIC